MQPLESSDPWRGIAPTVQFSIPACVDDLLQVVPPQARVLEIGCGYGRICRELVNHGFVDVTGYDSSPAMIERGHRESPDLKLRVSHGERIPEEDGSVDAVVGCAVLTCVPDPTIRRALIAEIERVLRPQGVFHVVEFAQGAGRSYDAEGRFRSGLGIDMVHFAKQKIQTELSLFDVFAFREFECRSVAGRPEKALLVEGRKRRTRKDAEARAVHR
jgi:ubiquinone/menaquinone biosynthesis C-methylase UbiE